MQNRSQFGSPLSPQTLARKFKNRIDDIINYNTERSHGVVVLFGGVFREEPYLYRIGPYGTTRRFTSTAAGKGWNMMMNQLEERPNATLDELEEQGIEAVSRVCDVDSDSVSLSVVQIPVETGTYTIDSEVATLTERNDT
jgi:20S proteasome alpha/beta subunit